MSLFQIFGTIQPPAAITAKFPAGPQGLPKLIGIVVLNLIVIAGLWFFINLILAGYQFLSSGDDPKAVSGAWAKIYQSLVGLVIIAASMLITAAISLIIFGDPTTIINITIFGPV